MAFGLNLNCLAMLPGVALAHSISEAWSLRAGLKAWYLWLAWLGGENENGD
jgi:hypothetical protein